MWIFTKCGFFSVTQHLKRKDNIQIRARRKQDLEDLKTTYSLLDRTPIIETPQADYRWRMLVARWKWEALAQKLTADIDYSNFKGKIATIPTQRNKGEILHDIWSIHHEYQEELHRTEAYDNHPRLFREAGDALFDDDDD